MKKIIILLFLVLLSISSEKVLAADKEIGFTVTDPTRILEVGRAGTYDYAPSAIEENGEKKVYVCGGGTSFSQYYDSIYLTVFNSSGTKTTNSKRVMEPLNSNSSDDGRHTCSPSVIKRSNQAIKDMTGGALEKYLLYYECAPNVFSKSGGGAIEGFTQICVAFSDDGINWKKYNENIWSSQGRFATKNEPATAVVKISSLMKENFGIEYKDGKWWTNLTGWEAGSYGVGHPSALVKDGQIWLYYYDSVGWDNNWGMYLLKSDDGLHFFTDSSNPNVPPVKVLNLVGQPAEIKYVDVPVLGHAGFFVAVYGDFYNYSWDGITWEAPDANNNPAYSIGQPFPGRCGLGGNTFLSDPYGTLHSLNVDVFYAEGYKGNNEGDWCTATNGCACYSSKEDGHRGYTWQTYMYKGKFSAITSTPIPGDLNGDSHVNGADYQILLANFGHPYTIFDYNVLVGNWGK